MTLLHTASATLAFICIGMNLGFSDVCWLCTHFSLTSMVFTFPNRLEDYFYTYLARFNKQSKADLSNKYFQYQEIYVVLCAIPMIAWLAAAPFIIPIIFGEQYSLYLNLCNFFSVFFVLKSLSFIRRVFYIKNISQNLLKLAIIRYIFEYSGYILFISIFGLKGVLFALVCSQFIFTILLFKQAIPYLNTSIKNALPTIVWFVIFLIAVLMISLCDKYNFLLGYWLIILATLVLYFIKLFKISKDGQLGIISQ